MNHKSNINLFIGSILCVALNACVATQDMVEKQYTPNTEGYEERVAQEMAPRSNGTQQTQNNNVPVIVNNPFAFGQTVGTPQQAAYGQQPSYAPMPNGFIQPAFAAPNSSSGSAYGSLNGAVQPGAIMQGNAPVYYPPQRSYGSGVYNPTR